MTQHSLKISVASSWVVLLLCAAAFFYFAVTIPNFISEDAIKDCDKHVQEIRASTDLHEVQQMATLQTQENAYVTASSRVLLIMAVAIFLICGICAGINLRQLRRLRRHLHETETAA